MDLLNTGKKAGFYKRDWRINREFKILLILFLVAICCCLSLYYYKVMGTFTIITHLFYIPIVISAIWWKRKALIIPAVLGTFLILVHLFFIHDVPPFSDYLRMIMFFIVGLVTVILNEQIARAEKITFLEREKLRFLTQRLSETEERHKQHIAAGLHDSVGPKLSAAKMIVQTIKRKENNTVSLNLDKVIECLDSSIVEIREMIFQLSPKVLYELGLQAAVESLIESIEKETSLNFKYEFKGPSNTLSQNIRSIIFRAIRELLLNTTKHAKAQKVYIEIENTCNNLIVTIEDDGVGFNVPEVLNSIETGRCFGLFSIRQQLLDINGNISIESNIGAGTKVALRFPIKTITESELKNADKYNYSGRSYCNA